MGIHHSATASYSQLPSGDAQPVAELECHARLFEKTRNRLRNSADQDMILTKALAKNTLQLRSESSTWKPGFERYSSKP